MERWTTADELLAARAAFEDAIAGWRRPDAHGLALVPPGAEVAPGHFPLVNRGEHVLPAVVLATVLGHVAGTAAYPVTRAELERAVGLLSPAEACDVWKHPNLWTWRDRYLPALDEEPAARLVAVFLQDGSDEPRADPAVTAFRVAAASR